MRCREDSAAFAARTTLLKPIGSSMCVRLPGGGALVGWKCRPRLRERHCDDYQLSVMGSVETTASGRAKELAQCEPMLWERSGG